MREHKSYYEVRALLDRDAARQEAITKLVVMGMFLALGIIGLLVVTFC